MRDIWIFNEEDKGFGFEGVPGGYLKIEIRQGKGKIYAMVQNLKETRPGHNYALYLLKIKEKDNKRVKIGSVAVNKGRGEFTWEFDPINVGGSNSVISDFNACALILENGQDSNHTNIQCPMIAYKKEKVRWKDGFVNEAMPVMDVNSTVVSIKKPIEDKYSNYNRNNIYDNSSDSFEKDAVVENTATEDTVIKEVCVDDEKPEVDIKLPQNEESNKEDIVADNREKREDKQEEKRGEKEDEKQNEIFSEESTPSDDTSEYIYDEQYIRKVLYQEMDDEILNRDKSSEISSESKNHIVSKQSLTDEEDISSKESLSGKEFIPTEEDIYEKEVTVYREPTDKEELPPEQFKINVEDDSNIDDNNNIKPEKESEINVEQQDDINAKQEDERTTRSYYSVKKTPDIIKLIRLLDREFKRCDPFNSRRRDYRWWSINSPVNLVNVLEESGINVPNFFSPSVIMAYFKYRYLIAGVYISRRGKVFFVCGIPGTYNIDESPFGDMCRWVQAERKSKRYGAFGYWVTYIDPYTGELLKFS